MPKVASAYVSSRHLHSPSADADGVALRDSWERLNIRGDAAGDDDDEHKAPPPADLFDAPPPPPPPPIDPAAVQRHGHAPDAFDVGGDPAAPPPPPRTVPMRVTDWSLYPQSVSDPVTDPDFCFWCLYAQSKQEYVDSKRVEKLMRFHKENFDHMNPFTFARKMQSMYNKVMREHLVYRGRVYRGPAWPARNIYEHLLTHKISPQTQYTQIARTCVTALKKLEENGIFREGTPDDPRESVDRASMELYLKIFKEVKPLLSAIEKQQNGDLFGL